MKGILLSRPVSTDPNLPDFDAAEGWVYLPEEYEDPYILINCPFEASKKPRRQPVLSFLFSYKSGPIPAKTKKKGA